MSHNFKMFKMRQSSVWLQIILDIEEYGQQKRLSSWKEEANLNTTCKYLLLIANTVHKLDAGYFFRRIIHCIL